MYHLIMKIENIIKRWKKRLKHEDSLIYIHLFQNI